MQKYGTPCHKKAQKCIKWFKDNTIELLDWPGNSPDLNPIENLWAKLKREVAKKRPSNQRDLIVAIISSWYHIISANDLRKLVDSMPNFCQAVIEATRYPTCY